MNGCKVQKVRIDLEPKCVCEDSKVRIYMSLVQTRGKNAQQIKRKKRRQFRINNRRRKLRWKRIIWRRRLKAARPVIVRNALCILISLIVTGAAGIWLTYLVHQIRGYRACGGEYLVILLMFYTVWKITRWILPES